MEDDEEHSHAHLRQQQLKTLCYQATRSPFAVFVAIFFVVIAVWEFVPATKVIAWAAVLMVFPIARGLYSSHVLRHPPSDAVSGLNFHIASTFTGGIVVGMAAPLFFEPLTDERRAFLTMILVCWAAAGVSAMAAYARVYYAYVAPIVLQIAGAWALVGSSVATGERFLAGSLILAAGVILSFFARDNERVLRESFKIRYENERLIAALERERQEVALARDRAEAANQAKSRFLAAASHDLRQPLHALSLYSGALTLHATDGETGNIGRSINQAVMSLSALVDSLLDISKLDAGVIKPQMQCVNVRSVIDRVETDFRQVAERKQLDFRVQSIEADVETDPALLEQILRNLLDNAMKYTVRGSVSLSAEAFGANIRVAVRDSGPGIAVSERDRIFEEFYQIDNPDGNPERDRPQGLGLGLAIVKRQAVLLGSDVELDSDPGKGAEFAIRMPRSRREPERSRSAAAASEVFPEAALAGTHVLVIDDEPLIRVGMRTLLEAWGCHVTVASGRAEAEQLVEQHGLGFDVIVADFRLRQHENGIDTVRHLRERMGEEVAALLITGDIAPERLREAHESGLPLLHKPVPPDKLREALLDALSR